MNPIRIAIFMILLLATISEASAADQPSKEVIKKYGARIQSGLQVPLLQQHEYVNKRIPFYFSVNEKGEVAEVIAITNDTTLKKELENGFRKIDMNGYPANTLSRIVVHIIVY